jgi:hypothetical protein
MLQHQATEFIAKLSEATAIAYPPTYTFFEATLLVAIME